MEGKKKYVIVEKNAVLFDNYLKNAVSPEVREMMQWDEDDPQYVITSPSIYASKRIRKELEKYYKDDNRIFIFLAGEFAYPDLNLFDYATVWDRHSSCGDRVMRIPNRWLWEQFSMGYYHIEDNDWDYKKAREAIPGREFCNFIYSNPFAPEMRDRLFYELSKYKKVESLGGHLNNMHNKYTRKQGNWEELSIQMKSKYKFTIVAENLICPGVTSEKLLDTFLAHSVPIYFGNPDVELEFNPDAMINVHNYNTMEEVVEAVRRIDEDDDLWARMVAAPWKTDEQLLDEKKRIAEMHQWMDHIFLQDFEKAQRRDKGTFAKMYYEPGFFHPEKNEKIRRVKNYLVRRSLQTRKDVTP